MRDIKNKIVYERKKSTSAHLDTTINNSDRGDRSGCLKNPLSMRASSGCSWWCWSTPIGDVFSYSSDRIVLVVSFFLWVHGCWQIVSDCLEEPWEDHQRRQRELENGVRDLEDLKGLIRRIGVLHEQDKISEETVLRCRDSRPVRRHNAGELFAWRAMC
jgi:hypothetical protein